MHKVVYFFPNLEPSPFLAAAFDTKGTPKQALRLDMARLDRMHRANSRVLGQLPHQPRVCRLFPTALGDEDTKERRERRCCVV